MRSAAFAVTGRGADCQRQLAGKDQRAVHHGEEHRPLAVQRRVDLATEVGNHAFQRGTLIEQFGVGQRVGKGRCGTAHKCLHGNRG